MHARTHPLLAQPVPQKRQQQTASSRIRAASPAYLPWKCPKCVFVFVFVLVLVRVCFRVSVHARVRVCVLWVRDHGRHVTPNPILFDSLSFSCVHSLSCGHVMYVRLMFEIKAPR